jgi:hypothetical protein
MNTIKEMLFVFGINTFVMLVAWAGLSVIIVGVRLFISPEIPLAKILSIHSFMVVLMCYAFYMVFDLYEYLYTKRKETK